MIQSYGISQLGNHRNASNIEKVSIKVQRKESEESWRHLIRDSFHQKKHGKDSIRTNRFPNIH